MVSVHTVYRGTVPRRPLGTTCRHMSSAHAIAESVCRGQVPRGRRTRVNQNLNLKSQKRVVMLWGLKGPSPSPAPCYCEPRSGRYSNTGRLAKSIWADGYGPLSGLHDEGRLGNSYRTDGPPNWRPLPRWGASLQYLRPVRGYARTAPLVHPVPSHRALRAVPTIAI